MITPEDRARIVGMSTLSLSVTTAAAISPVIFWALIAYVAFSLLIDAVPVPLILYLGGIVGILLIIAIASMSAMLTGWRRRGFATLGTVNAQKAFTFIGLGFLIAILLRFGAQASFLLPGGSEEGAAGRLLPLLGIPLLALAAVATIFPAVMDEGDASIRAALGRKALWPVLFRFAGAIVISCIVSLVAVVLVGLLVAPIAEREEGGEMAGILLAFVFGAPMAFGAVMASAIVTKAYLGAYAKGADTPA